MLKRQRTMLTLLRRLGGKTGRLDLMKLAFILSTEERGGGDGFYSFVPYHYGPYSFSLMQEMTALIRDGFVTQPDDKTWALTPAGAAECSRNPGPVAGEVGALAEKFGTLGTSKLIDLVYDQHPWFALNTKLERKARPPRPTAEPAVYTVGYEKLSVEGLLDALLRSGMRTLIDVRRNPLSRRYGFHGSTLKRLCECVGIGYLHLPALGIASEDRRDLVGPAAYERLFAQYEKTTLLQEHESIERCTAHLVREASAVMCAEADPCFCHRGRLAKEVSRRSGLGVIHLAWPRQSASAGELWASAPAS